VNALRLRAANRADSRRHARSAGHSAAASSQRSPSRISHVVPNRSVAPHRSQTDHGGKARVRGPSLPLSRRESARSAGMTTCDGLLTFDPGRSEPRLPTCRTPFPLAGGLDRDPGLRSPYVRARVRRRARHDGATDREPTARSRLTRKRDLVIDLVTPDDTVGDPDASCAFGARTVFGSAPVRVGGVTSNSIPGAASVPVHCSVPAPPPSGRAPRRSAHDIRPRQEALPRGTS
jgi:hypothetical protein